MKRREKKKRPSWLLRVLAGVVILVVVVVFGGWIALKIWLKNYLAGDACRDLIARQIGRAAKAECTLDPLSWSGASVYSAKASLAPSSGAGWSLIEADSVQAVLDWNGVRRGVWSVPVINLDSLQIKMAGTEKSASSKLAKAVSNEAEKTGVPAPAPSAPAWIRPWIPTRTEIGEVKMERFDLIAVSPASGVTVDGIKLSAKPAADEGAWLLRGSGGSIRLPDVQAPFRLASATARVDARALSLDDAVASWIGECEVTARGEFIFGGKPWSFTGRVNNLDLKHLISGGWTGKLSGVMEGDYDASAKPPASVLLKGKLRVKSGVVQGLPLLDRVADFTHTERFRRVVLDEAISNYERQGERLRLSELVLQSNGLIRVEGDVIVEGRGIDGRLLVGVSPETLRWMPGAQNHVFTDPHPGGIPGFVWTHVHVTGTVDNPREDLSNRLLAAAGKAVLDAPMEILGTGLNVIEKAGTGVPGAKPLIDGGRGILKEAGDAAGAGADLLKQAIPFLPK